MPEPEVGPSSGGSSEGGSGLPVGAPSREDTGRQETPAAGPRIGTTAWFWKKAKEYAGKYADKLVMAGIGIAVGWVISLFFRPPVTIHIPQTMFGNHCAKDLFDAAKADGVQLGFDSDTTYRMTICGAGVYETGRMLASLTHYVDKVYPDCLTRTTATDGSIDIAAKRVEGREVRDIALPNGTTLTYCRCYPEQINRIIHESDMICGVATR